MPGRRAKGEGTVRQRADGGWEAREPPEVVPPGQKPRSFYARTKTEAIRKLRDAIRDREDGLDFDARKQTLEEFLQRWLRDSVKGSVKQRTYDGYEYVVRVHIVPELGHVKLGSLTPAHAQALYRSKLDDGLSNRTVRYVHQTLHRALKQATRWRLIPANPIEATDPPRKVKRQLDVWGLEDVLRFFEAARSDRMGPLYVLAASTGLREGELLGLWWHDVDLDAPGGPVLRIQRNLVRSSIGVSIEHLKNDEARAVELTRVGVAALRAQRKRQLEERLAAGSRWGVPRMAKSRRYNLGDLVFTTRRGTHVDPSNLSACHFRPFLERAELPRIRFHDLRHTLATVMFSELAAHPKAVQGMFGHKDIKITMDTYTHYLPTMQGPWIQRLDDVFGDWPDDPEEELPGP